MNEIHDVRTCKCERCTFTKRNPGMDWDKWNAHKGLQKENAELKAEKEKDSVFNPHIEIRSNLVDVAANFGKELDKLSDDI